MCSFSFYLVLEEKVIFIYFILTYSLLLSYFYFFSYYLRRKRNEKEEKAVITFPDAAPEEINETTRAERNIAFTGKISKNSNILTGL